MAQLYANNKTIIKIGKDDPDFKIIYGDWKMPNCCSLIVLILYMIFIILAIYF